MVDCSIRPLRLGYFTSVMSGFYHDVYSNWMKYDDWQLSASHTWAGRCGGCTVCRVCTAQTLVLKDARWQHTASRMFLPHFCVEGGSGNMSSIFFKQSGDRYMKNTLPPCFSYIFCRKKTYNKSILPNIVQVVLYLSSMTPFATTLLLSAWTWTCPE